MDSSHPDFWESRYQASDTSWDLNGPTPVFLKLLQDQVIPCGEILIPGAGRGYDAIAWAKAGFSVTAVDLALSACETLRRTSEAAGVELKVQQADFFDLPEAHAYDVILEYTFFCAIPVASRSRYREKMTQLLKPGGLLVGLFFPLEPIEPDGPPFGVDVEELKALFGPSFDLMHESFPSESIKPRAGREVLMIWKKR